MAHEGHRERLRQRFLETGSAGFAEHELLELLLFYAIPRQNTNPIAHALLDRFKSIKNVLSASEEELRSVAGVGAATASFIKLIPEVAKAYVEDKNSEGIMLIDPKVTGKFIVDKFEGLEEDKCAIICLDQRGKYLSFNFLTENDFDRLQLNAREIAKFAMEVQAANIILAHTHMGRSEEVTFQDIEATNRLQEKLKPVSINIFDHFIVSGKRWFSLRNTGAYSPYNF